MPPLDLVNDPSSAPHPATAAARSTPSKLGSSDRELERCASRCASARAGSSTCGASSTSATPRWAGAIRRRARRRPRSAAARRETAQYREDRDHVRRQLQTRTEELATAQARLQALDGDRAPLPRAQEAAPEVHPPWQASLRALGQELTEVQEALARSPGGDRGRPDPRARAAAVFAALADELAIAKAEVEAVHTVLAEERRAADARESGLCAQLAEARQGADKAAEWEEIARLRAELAAQRAAATERQAGEGLPA